MEERREKKDRKGRRNKFGAQKKKYCRFCADKNAEKNKIIDYKDLKTIESFVKERGRIVSARITGNCAKHQRQLARAIKRARFISLIPYVKL